MKRGRNTEWDLVIRPGASFWNLRFRELWDYRDLVLVLVRRDFVAVYKQTLLGPLWYLLQPLLTTLVYVVIFGKIAQIPTDGIPQLLFYLSGVVLWNYFANCLTKTSGTFIENASLFGKVYFPRLVVPLSVVISNFNTFLVQFVLFIGFYLYYLLTGSLVRPNAWAWLFPLLVLFMGLFGLGIGILVSAMTTRYRDLRFLITFGVQLFMFATPVIYPLSQVPASLQVYVRWNPITPVMEAFRYGWLGAGSLEPGMLFYSFGCALLLILFGVLYFNKIERNFQDTV